jgi:hypothetical protein
VAGHIRRESRWTKGGFFHVSIHPGSNGSTSSTPFLSVDMVPHGFAFPKEPGFIQAPPIFIDIGSGFSSISNPEYFAQTFSLTLPSSSADASLGPIAYPQFFGAPWEEAVQVVYSYDVPLVFSADPTDTGTFDGAAYYRSFVPRAQLPDPLVPTLGPATAPLLNGTDAFAFQARAGEQPVFPGPRRRWAPRRSTW